MAEELAEFGLHAQEHAGKHARRQGWQRQLAASLKCFWTFRMPDATMELLGMQMGSEIGQQRGERYAKPMKIKKTFIGRRLPDVEKRDVRKARGRAKPVSRQALFL